MKKYWAVLLVLPFAAIAVVDPAWAAEAAEAAAEATKEGSAWTPVLGKFLTLLFEILTPVILALGSWAVWKLAAKFGMEKNKALDDKVRSLIKQGINYADKWAANMKDKPAGTDKKAQAVDFVLELLNKDGIKSYAKGTIEKMIEAQLGFDDKALPKPEGN
jgi:hypothetical protein